MYVGWETYKAVFFHVRNFTYVINEGICALFKELWIFI